jgi:hypothetical protein
MLTAWVARETGLPVEETAVGCKGRYDWIVHPAARFDVTGLGDEAKGTSGRGCSEQRKEKKLAGGDGVEGGWEGWEK